jgi:hypothetical protein
MAIKLRNARQLRGSFSEYAFVMNEGKLGDENIELYQPNWLQKKKKNCMEINPFGTHTNIMTPTHAT